MKIVNNLSEIAFSEKLYITIGNFDGVHFGHSKLLEFIKERSKSDNAKLLVITFVPHPLLILRPCQNYLINSYEERRELLKNENVDYLLEIEFGRDFSNLLPEVFLDKYILHSNHDKILHLGHDFAFGADKKGNYQFTKKYCKQYSVEVYLLPKFQPDEKLVSSSEVRESLRLGDLLRVNQILQRNYFIMGTVVKGLQRGSSIGFPTANLEFLKERVTPARGVYITRTEFDNEVYESVTNVGHNPTFESDEILHIETHILDFDKKIYGKNIKVSFIKKIRDELKFNSIEELVLQIKKDVHVVELFFKERDE